MLNIGSIQTQEILKDKLNTPYIMINNKNKRIVLLFFLLISTLLVSSGCNKSVIISPIKSPAERIIELGPNESIGQTFSTDFDGLQEVDIFSFENEETSITSLQLHIYANPNSLAEIAHGSFTTNSDNNVDYYQIPLTIEHLQVIPMGEYYLSIENTGSSSLQVPIAAGNSYISGSAYLNDNPINDGQLGFRLSYSTRSVISTLASEGLVYLKWLLIIFIFFILPGWGIFSFLFPKGKSLYWETKLPISFGLSVVCYAILLLISDTLGLRIGNWNPWLLLFISAILWMWSFNWQFCKIIPKKFTFRLDYFGGIFLVLFVLIFFIRLYQVRTFPLPLWGDSLHHTMITQLIIDNKGLFKSWLPYAELNSFTYHFGFHASAAIFSQISSLSSGKAVLIFGQIVNSFAVLSIYPLAVKLGKNKWAGLFGILIAGLLIPTPNFLMNWGLYTILSGFLLLSLTLWLLSEIFTEHQPTTRTLVLTGLFFTGILLTHYRVALYLTLFLISFLLLGENIIKNIKKLILPIFFTTVISLPWLLRIFPSNLVTGITSLLTTKPSDLSTQDLSANSIGSITIYMQAFFWLLLIISSIWAVWRREATVLKILGGCGLIILAANPSWFNLPGTGVLKNFFVIIGVFIPTGIIVGTAGGWLMDMVMVDCSLLRKSTFGFSVIAISLFGFSRNINPNIPLVNFIVTPPDIRAAEWIKVNTPEDSIFLINSFFTNNDTTVVGGDGGWWLPLIAHRATSQPPLVYLSESSSIDNYRVWINSLSRLIYEKGINSPEVLAEIENRHITYIYIGQVHGAGGNYTGQVLLNLTDILSTPKFQEVYHEDRVWIFKILY